MKINKFILILGFLSGPAAFSQPIEPVITMNDNPVTYAMHLCSDGKHYYAVNGGVAKDGRISQFSLEGTFITYNPLKLDMRSIMYNARDKSFYINTKEKEIYKVIDMVNGTVQLVHSGIYENEQATLALDPKGKYFYALDNGSLSVINAKTGKLEKKFSGLNCGNKGMKGSTTVAVDKKHVYTWDADTRTVYVYNLNGVFAGSFQLQHGTVGHSLSIANGLIFVARSEMGKPAIWYGYQIPRL
jgi:DNA-binding beta-propeller fold protein YncE